MNFWGNTKPIQWGEMPETTFEAWMVTIGCYLAFLIALPYMLLWWSLTDV